MLYSMPNTTPPVVLRPHTQCFSRPSPLFERIHLKARDICRRYQKCAGELLEILDEADQHKIFLHRQYSSLIQYCILDLGLSESIAYNLTTVMRKSREVPALRAAVTAGTISLSNARKITPVLTSANQNQWLEKATTLSQRELEKEVVKIRPELAVKELTRYISESRIKMELALDDEAMQKLRRAQDLISRSRSKSASLENTIVEMTEFFLRHKDPVEKAKRVTGKQKKSQHRTRADKPVALQAQAPMLQPSEVQLPVVQPSGVRPPSVRPRKRTPIPAKNIHEVNLRDAGKCTFITANGKRCEQQRWTEVHHRIPVAAGGSNHVDNLVTLCSTHHRWLHSTLEDRRQKTDTPYPLP